MAVDRKPLAMVVHRLGRGPEQRQRAPCASTRVSSGASSLAVSYSRGHARGLWKQSSRQSSPTSSSSTKTPAHIGRPSSRASDDEAYVQSWMAAHPDREILITEELADETLWNYFPALTATSLGLVVWELWQRYRRGTITLSRFKWLVARTTGLKAGKLGVLSLAMSIPGLNVVTGTALVARLILSAIGTANSLGKGIRPTRR